MLERLYLLKWGPMDGLGAVVISPTRELAVQTFNMLRDIGKYHSFSAGLVIGGKPLKEERDRLGRMNILIATPGRLLQHLDSTVGFESAGVKVLGMCHLFYRKVRADGQYLTRRTDYWILVSHQLSKLSSGTFRQPPHQGHDRIAKPCYSRQHNPKT